MILKIRSLLRLVAKVLSPLIEILENRFLKKTPPCQRKNYSPIFIIGSPRSGSTVLYQMLTHSLDCLYIDNLVHVFFRNIFFGFWVSNNFFRDSSHNSFNSKFGNTNSWHSPSECAGFWFRWFPKKFDFVIEEDLNREDKKEIKETINFITKKYCKDILFKNLTSGQRIRVLHEIFPNAKFIYIKREPLYTAQSLYLARRKNKLPDDMWWSVKPKNFEKLNNLPIYEKIVKQIYFVEKQIHNDLYKIPKKNVFQINYSDYKKDYLNLLKFTGCKRKNDLDLKSFDFSNKKTLDSEDIEELENEIRKLDWGSIGYE